MFISTRMQHGMESILQALSDMLSLDDWACPIQCSLSTLSIQQLDTAS